MTIKKIIALNKYYASHPPVHIMIASYLGIDAKKEKKASKEQIDSILEEMKKEGIGDV